MSVSSGRSVQSTWTSKVLHRCVPSRDRACSTTTMTSNADSIRSVKYPLENHELKEENNIPAPYIPESLVNISAIEDYDKPLLTSIFERFEFMGQDTNSLNSLEPVDLCDERRSAIDLPFQGKNARMTRWDSTYSLWPAPTLVTSPHAFCHVMGCTSDPDLRAFRHANPSASNLINMKLPEPTNLSTDSESTRPATGCGLSIIRKISRCKSSMSFFKNPQMKAPMKSKSLVSLAKKRTACNQSTDGRETSVSKRPKSPGWWADLNLDEYPRAHDSTQLLSAHYSTITKSLHRE